MLIAAEVLQVFDSGAHGMSLANIMRENGD
jgi:hypothetical protein